MTIIIAERIVVISLVFGLFTSLKYSILLGINFITLLFLVYKLRKKHPTINITTPKDGIIEVKYNKTLETLAFLTVREAPIILTDKNHLKKNSSLNSKSEITPHSHINTFYNLKIPFFYEIQTDGAFVTLAWGTKSSKPVYDDEIKMNMDNLETAIQTAYLGIELGKVIQSELLRMLVHPLSAIPDYFSISDSVGTAYFENGKRKEYFSVISLQVSELDLIDLNRKYTDDIISFFITRKIRATVSIISSPIKTFFSRSKKADIESQRIRKSPKKLSDDKKIKEKTAYNQMRSHLDSSPWNYQVRIILVDDDENRLKRNIKRTVTALSTIFMHGKSDITINILRRNKLKKGILMYFCRRFSKKYKTTSGLLSHLVALPSKSYPGMKVSQKPLFLPHSSMEIEKLNTSTSRETHKGKVYLGNSIWAKNSSYPIFVNLSSLMLHTAIIGESGFGKTEYVKFLVRQINQTAPEVKWLIFDFKGEYVKEFKFDPDVQLISLGNKEATFSINLLDAGEDDSASHVNKLFFILYNAMSDLFNSSAELTPQMERLLKESLLNAVRRYKKKGILENPIDIIFEEIEKYVVANRAKNPTLIFSAEALKNRLTRLKEGALSFVFNASKGFLDITKLMAHNTIIDLSPLIIQGALLQDLQLVVSILAKYVFDCILKRGLVRTLKHITIFEEANLILPSSGPGRINVLEEMALMIRSMGEGLIFVSQRPTISHNILANAATKIVFRTTIDSEIISKMLNLTEEQLEYVKVLPVGEAIASLPNFPTPVRLKINLDKKNNNLKRRRPVESHLKSSRKLLILWLISEGWDTFELLQRKVNFSPIELRLILDDLINSNPQLIEKEGIFFRLTDAGLNAIAFDNPLQIVK